MMPLVRSLGDGVSSRRIALATAAKTKFERYDAQRPRPLAGRLNHAQRIAPLVFDKANVGFFITNDGVFQNRPRAVFRFADRLCAMSDSVQPPPLAVFDDEKFEHVNHASPRFIRPNRL
jgi:hypothetical protein